MKHFSEKNNQVNFLGGKLLEMLFDNLQAFFNVVVDFVKEEVQLDHLVGLRDVDVLFRKQREVDRICRTGKDFFKQFDNTV